MRLLLICFLFLFQCSLQGQEDSLTTITVTETIFTAGPKIKTLTIDLSNPDEAELVLKKIHTFRYLESITLDGEVDEATLKKLIYRVSVLKNLRSLTLRENDLRKLPENIVTLRNLQSLTIEGNAGLDYTDVFNKIKSLSLNELKLIDNDLKKVPATLSQLSSLKKILISGSNQLDYAGLVDQLVKIRGLTTLSIPVNYISELPKNIELLTFLQVLDVSNNNLSELPKEISGLKAINNLSIQGNLLLDPAKDLENLKGNTIQYLALDKEISGEDLEQIKKMFPTAQIDFPQSREDAITDSLVADLNKSLPVTAPHKGELKAKKEVRLLSGAYAMYSSLFQPILYTFDTLTFEERYRDLRYETTFQIVTQGFRRGGAFHFSKSRYTGEGPAKRKETWFSISTNDPRVAGNFPELRAFSGMYWIYKGTLSKKEFYKKYFKNKKRSSSNPALGTSNASRKLPIPWNDIRIKYDNNNSQFIIQVKNDSAFSEFTACPVFAALPINKSIQTYTKKYLLYQKYLTRRAQSFTKIQKRERALYDLSYRSMKDYAWKELQLRMSDDEKLMTQEEWLEYYDNIIANEENAIENSALSTPFIFRALTLKGYNSTNALVTQAQAKISGANTFRTKQIDADFVNADGSGKLAVSTVVVLDTKTKIFQQISGTFGLNPTTIELQQFASFKILVQLRNGNWGTVSSEEIDKQNFDPTKTYSFKTTVFDKNLDTIGGLLQSALN